MSYKHLLNILIVCIIMVAIFNTPHLLFKLSSQSTSLNVYNNLVTLNSEFTPTHAPSISYEAIQYSDEDPADPHLAVGPEDIVLVVNSKFEVYDKSNSGTALHKRTFNDFFSNLLPDPDVDIFDPRVIFDSINNRFIMIAVASNSVTQEAWWVIAASQQSSAIGNWRLHITDATLDDYTPTTNYPDFPDVGLDGTYLYLTADMRDFNTSNFQYNKVRIVYLDDIYERPISSYNDIIDWRNEGDGVVQSLRVVQQKKSSDIIYFMNMVSSGKLSLWSLEDPLNAQTRTRITVNVGDFIDPPDAEQPDTATRIETNDPRLLEAKLGENGIWTTHTIGYDPGTGDKAAVRLYEIKTDGSEVLNQITLVSSSDYIYYPSLVMDKVGNLIVQFSMSSATRYASIAFTGRLSTDAPHSINPAVTLIKAGEAAYTDQARWGDYSGTAIDPTDGHTIWMFNQYATTDNKWSTWVATITHFKYNVFVPLVFK